MKRVETVDFRIQHKNVTNSLTEHPPVQMVSRSTQYFSVLPRSPEGLWSPSFLSRTGHCTRPWLPVGTSPAPPISSEFSPLAQGLGPALPCQMQTWCSCCCCCLCCVVVSGLKKRVQVGGGVPMAEADSLCPPRDPARAATL